jgi:hypothetical protein
VVERPDQRLAVVIRDGLLTGIAHGISMVTGKERAQRQRRRVAGDQPLPVLPVVPGLGDRVGARGPEIQ